MRNVDIEMEAVFGLRVGEVELQADVVGGWNGKVDARGPRAGGVDDVVSFRDGAWILEACGGGIWDAVVGRRLTVVEAVIARDISSRVWSSRS
jgi:hypothetical protein